MEQIAEIEWIREEGGRTDLSDLEKQEEVHP
jgi:hypothetical protein